MNAKLLMCVSLAVLAIGASCGAVAADAASAKGANAAGKPMKRSVYVNYDDTHFGHSRWKAGIVPDEAGVRELVRKYRGTDVTDLLFCIGGRIADVTNSVKESWCDKYHQTEENGRKVDYKNGYVKLYRDLCEVKHLDIFALWCDEARKCGIHPWLSFRLNDCHDNASPTSRLHPNFFHRHPEYRRIRHREPKGYFDRCLDYGIAAVREREIKFIAEMLERYDTDGVELDWQREIYCFQPGQESCVILTSFTREVRKLCAASAKRRGHPIRIMARVPADPETALRFGFDVATWADEKLVDVVVPCPRWESQDNEIATDLWARLLRGTSTELAPGIEIRMGYINPFYMTTEQIVGAIAAHYAAGAGGIYFFNYFDDPKWQEENAQYWKSFKQPRETMGVWWGNQLKWLKMIGDSQKVFSASRDHMLTYRDIVPLWEDVHSPIPTSASAGRPKFFRLSTGPVPAKCRLELRLGVKGGVPPKRVFVNSRPCTYVRNEPCVPAFTADPLCVYSLAPYPEEAAVVEVLPDANVTISHLDLRVR